jgi:hypothetical protein
MGAPCIFFLILLLGGLAWVSPVLSLVTVGMVIAVVLWSAISKRRGRAVFSRYPYGQNIHAARE